MRLIKVSDLELRCEQGGSNGAFTHKPGEYDLENLSDSDLRELGQKVKQAQRERFTRDLDELRMRAHEAGYEIVRLGEGTGKRQRRSQTDLFEGSDRRGAVQAKYRNPDKPSDVWSGRGKPPKWMQDKLDAGRKREEFLIRSDKTEPAETAA